MACRSMYNTHYEAFGAGAVAAVDPDDGFGADPDPGPVAGVVDADADPEPDPEAAPEPDPILVEDEDVDGIVAAGPVDGAAAEPAPVRVLVLVPADAALFAASCAASAARSSRIVRRICLIS